MVALTLTMGQNPNETSPIAGEPASLKHIGYALELIGKIIQDVNSPTSTFLYDVACDSTPHLEELIKIQHHIINAKYAVPEETIQAAKIDEDDPTLADREIATEHAFLILEDIPHGDSWEAWTPDEDDHTDGSCEGEMRAEAEAERQADAAAELAAEQAYGYYEGWD